MIKNSNINPEYYFTQQRSPHSQSDSSPNLAHKQLFLLSIRSSIPLSHPFIFGVSIEGPHSKRSDANKSNTKKKTVKSPLPPINIYL